MLKYTDYEKEVAIEFANDLVKSGIQLYLTPTPLSYDEKKSNRQNFYKNLEALPYSTTVASGATRGVFMRDDGELDRWVLKVDFNDNSRDYCEREANFYQEAIEQEVSWAFAATYYLTTIDEIDFYIQERLDCDCEDSTSEKIAEYIVNKCGITQEDGEDDLDFQSRIWDYEDSYMEWDDVLNCIIGDADVEEFVYSRDINDLHQANYGMTSDGYFKIVDYCGYYE